MAQRGNRVNRLLKINKPLAWQTKGYTLVEILIVLFIMGLVTSIAVLTVSRNTQQDTTELANTLVQMLHLAEEKAVLETRPLGFAVHNHDYQWLRLQTTRWIPFTDTLFKTVTLPALWQLTLRTPTQTPATPHIVIATNGTLTPFKLYIGKRHQAPCYVIVGHANGAVTKQALCS